MHHFRRLGLGICLLLFLNHSVLARADKQYKLDITADFQQATTLTDDDDCIPIKVEITQDRHLLRELVWQVSPHQSSVTADGKLRESKGEWQWIVPKKGGALSYCMQLNHLRGDRYDSKIASRWALFRADDLFPSVASVALRDSYSSTQLKFKLPPNWSSVTAYPEINNHTYRVDNPTRLFDRPTGWVQLGELGIRRDIIAGTKTAVSAPVGQEVTRLEIVTLLTFTLPTFRDWFPEFPQRLLVVSANEDMWRGALSGPASLYLHGERPLVSENGTSTVMHELVHVAIQREAAFNADWIDEGLAEYLALVLLHEAGGLTNRRYRNAIDQQERWGKSAKRLETLNSSGAATAKAVTVFAQLHKEIGDKAFRKLVKKLAKPGPAITPSMLRKLVEGIVGKKALSLSKENIN